MSDYVPTEADIINGMYHLGDNFWRELTEAEVARGIARIKAEALREALLSDEAVEQAALGIHASHDRGDWDEELPVVQDEYRDMARAALTAALGEDESNE